MQLTTIKVRRPRRCSRGYTLFELLFALPLAALILYGVVDVFIMSSQLFVRTNAQIDSSQDASNAIQHIINEVREAQTYALATENTFVLPSKFNQSEMSTTYNGETVNTSMELFMPPNLTPSEVGYQSGSQISVTNTAGNAVAITPYYSDGTSSQTVLIYRGDPNETPDPNPSGATTTAAYNSWLSAPAQSMRPTAGTYLWEYNVSTGSYIALCKSVALSPDAVQFIRPTTDPSGVGMPQPYEVEVNVVSAYYSPITGQVSNESSSGNEVSTLTGQCVYMRDHQTSPTTPSNANTASSNNAIQFSR